MAEAAEVETKARSMGWLPETEFRGKKENWKPAAEYVARGEEFIPFLQADRKRLETELQSTNGKLGELSTQLKEASETIQALKEFRTELNKERVETLKEELVEGIKNARESGDIAKEEGLRDNLAEAKKPLEAPVV